MTTAVPQIQWTPTGIVVPTQAAVLAGVQSDLNAAFGGNLNPALNTPQGQLATSLSAVIANCYAAIAYFVNNIDPNFSSGFLQDAVGAIYFLPRNPGLPTSVQCLCTGLQGTLIPAGAQAQDTSGNLYTCEESGTIPGGGSITLPFSNVVDGPIACPANTLTKIYVAIPGWDSINNVADGEVGANVESQASYALRRADSVAANAQGSLQSIYGAVFEVPGVIDAYVTENDNATSIFVGSTNYELVPHSIYVAVVGGAAQAIAQAIYTKKSPGSDYNGNTTEVVTDQSGYQIPYPSYNITFNIPTPTPILFAVSVQNNTSLPSNIAQLVKDAIVAQFTGANGAPRARIGALLLAASFYAPVIAVAPNLSVLSILLGTSSANATSVQMGIDQAPTIDPSNITVTLV